MPQARLKEYLRDIGDGSIGTESPDCSIVPAANGTFLLSTTDFFYPLVADPFLQGQIACCNVLSDLYALGVDRIDTVLMLLGVCLGMSESERKIVTSEMIRGFNHSATQAGTAVTGGQTVMNPWPTIGGVAMTVATEAEFVRPLNAEEGDVLVLTKPIGTQIAVNLYEWFHDKPNLFEKLHGQVSSEEVHRIYNAACVSMSSLNRTGARLMRKYGAKAATDVTGFGLLGHAQNLASVQSRAVSFVIHSLPVIRGVPAIDKQVYDFKLREGFSAETSGGLLIVLPRTLADAFVQEFRGTENAPCWIVGEVVNGEKSAVIAGDAEFIEV